MHTLPTTGLSALLAELGELPDGLDTPVRAGLVVADTLRAVGFGDAVIAARTGVDLAALEGTHAEAVR